MIDAPVPTSGTSSHPFRVSTRIRPPAGASRALLAVCATLLAAGLAQAQNAIVTENALPGNPRSEWDVSGAGDASIQGFATDISVDQGGIIRFKVSTNSTNYRLDVYRLGWYAGLGARKVATVQPSASLPQTQPACLTNASTGLVDCGNWAVSASWTVPATATSGIYIARLVREDPEDGRASHMVFVVRDDDGGSKILLQTSDPTWQAYNTYGGNSLYNGAPAGRAYKVSYNRPFTTRCCEYPNGSTRSWLFDAEYPMVRWLERNGYDVSYATGVDTDRRGAELLEHRVFLSVGHDEYWSAGQRASIEAARAAGVHLGLFSGNLGFWKTRWESSIDGSGTTYRTLVCYKETQANAKIDPQPGVWTGTWRDPRFGPHDGGRPENALNGPLFTVNGIRTDTPLVPAADGKMRFWRNTSVATLTAGQTAVLPTGVLGFEWDEEIDNGSRPPGLVRLSSTTIPGANVLADFGSTYVWGPATHHLTLYRHASGALVFGAGTVQWPWGLDDVHDYPGAPTDARMQQATVNLLADMQVQPATLQSGLVAATASTDTTAPAATITSPTSGATVETGTPVTVSGTASDVGGQVGGVEVSTDGGTTWHPADGRAAWSYQWVPSAAGSATLRARAVDDSGNLGAASAGVSVTIVVKTCPCSLWSDSTLPAQAAVNDPGGIELGIKFTADVGGVVTGIRFYKGPGNTGTHLGRLWTATGTLLGTVTFTGETASGWQTASFASPIAISANTTYVASYFTPAGNYAFNIDYFGSSPGSVVRPPLRAPQSSVSGGNGVYRYGAGGVFPTDTYGASNYWVDVVFVDGTATTTTTTTSTTTTTVPTTTTTTTAPTTTTTAPTTTTSTTTTTTTTSTTTTSTTTTTTTSTTTTTFPAGSGIVFSVPGFVQETVASGLPFATGVAFAPDGRMFIALKGGVVRVYQNGTLLPAPFLDITAQVANSNDRGLLGIAVHPNFPATPYLYLLYTWNPPGFSNTAVGGRVSRLIRVTADAAQGYNVATAGSDQPQTVVGGPGHVLLLGTNSTAANIGNPTDGRDTTKASCMTGLSMAGAPIEDCLPSDEDSHSIGTVMFGLDGSLYVGNGDGSNYTDVDPRALRAQNGNSLAGKIMRIDPATGLGLPDNPSFDASCPQCNRSKVYARGLRNPFRFTIHPLTNEPFIGDVGWNTWEEINTGKGANFGWPCYEGGAAGSPAPVESGTTTSRQQGSYATNAGTSAACATLYGQGLGAVRAPLFSYSHSGTDGAGTSGGASANGGAFYTGTVYPPQYQQALFILDYNRRWIRYLTFDAQGKATVNNFGREANNGMVQVLTGPDTNLYAVVLAGSGSQVRRIRYVGAGNTPPTAVANAAPTIGTAPLAVTFSSLGSFDPDAQPLSYSWTFGDGGTSTAQHPSHTYTASGVYTATLTLTELTAPFASSTAQAVITVGNEPPIAHITAPPDGTTYRIGDVITYSGSGTSGGQPVDPSQLSWELRLHHNEHIHFNVLPGGAGGTFQIIEHGDNTFYELCLTATVPPNLTDTRCVNLLPRTTPITLTTDPPGLFVNYEDEGLTQASPMIVNPVVGSAQTVSVQAIQGGLTFAGWADGQTSASHPFVVGTSPATYTARYVNQPPTAVAQGAPRTGAAPLTVTFTGSGSSDPELGTLDYSWDFGDGASTDQADPVHIYTAAGTYTATLTVTDQRDGVASGTVTVTVAGTAQCGNGQVEAGEACDGGACCTAGCQFAGAGAVCRPAAGACDVAETCTGSSAACPANVLAPNGASCSDGNLCNGAETCQSGACTAGTALVCNDGNVCTTDSCNPATGCAFTNNTAPCSDGVACTSDVCAGGVCTGTSTCGAGQTCNLGTGACDTASPPSSIWPATTVPTNIAGADLPVELGLKFRSDVSGYVTAIRFYKDPRNTGTHVGNLWSVGGTRLAQATFTGESAGGWQQVNLSPPVAIAANTVFIVSYLSPNGFYAISPNFFATQGVDNPPLHALASGVSGANGVFTYNATSTFPTSSYANSNYWVDVVFSAVPPTLQSIAVTPATPTVTVGGTQQFTATGTYADGSTQNLTSQVTWTSSSPAVASVNATGLATTASTGTTTITAAQGAVSGHAALTVAPVGAVSVTTTALPGATQGAAYTTTLGATGGTPPYTWSIASGTLPPGLALTAGSGVIAGTPTATGTYPFTVQVTAGAQTATKALSIVVAQTVQSIWSAATVPGLADGGPDSTVELGVKFRSDVAGYVTGIRFYKHAANTGTHVGNLWSLAGTRLATATFSGETASGWQQVTFSSPVAIAANTLYVASYRCPNGHYSADLNYFASQAVDNPPLHAIATGASGGPNGVFAYGATSTFPNQTWFAANYWVDVMFSTTAP